MSEALARTGPWAAVREEVRKFPAFFRRDLLIMVSYRLAFISDWFSLIIQVLVFYFVGRLIDPQKLPRFGGRPASYMEFVAVGIAITSFLQVGLSRVVSAIRNEQLMGTLESVLMTPTALSTFQLGSVTYDLFYIPVRTVIFLGLVAGLFGVHFDVSGLAPAAAMLLAFIPFVWGLGVLGAAGVLTFRRGSGVVGIAATILTLSSGAYFPTSVLPGWIRFIAELNPITMSLTAIREALLGGAGWRDVGPAVLKVLPLSAASLLVGIWAFRLALARERRRGTLGLY